MIYIQLSPEARSCCSKYIITGIGGTFVVVTRFSTEERILRIGGELMPNTRRQIDERLIDTDGRAIVELNNDEWGLLRDLASRAGQRATISGNANRKPLDNMVGAGLITSRALNLSDTEHELTGLGRLVLDQLS